MPFRFMASFLCVLCLGPLFVNSVTAAPSSSLTPAELAAIAKEAHKQPIPNDSFSGVDRSKMTLSKVVIITTEGITAPLMSRETMKLLSQHDWPEWPVQPGVLTDRGTELLHYLWRDVRTKLAWNNLLPVDSCFPQSELFLRADNQPATQSSARAILEGLAPGCNLKYESLSGSALDPLFHPSENILTSGQIQERDQQVAALGIPYQFQKHELSAILGELSPSLCQSYGLPAGCTFEQFPLQAAIPTGSAQLLNLQQPGETEKMAENIIFQWLKQSAQWPELPNQNVGFGVLTQEWLEKILPLRAAVFNTMSRYPAFAKIQSENILQRLHSIFLKSQQIAVPAFPQEAIWAKNSDSASLNIFVGHDSDIAALAEVLGLHWNFPGYPSNAVPPGAALIFSQWTGLGQKQIAIHIVMQNISTLSTRDPQLLGAMNPIWLPVSFDITDKI